MQFLQYWESGDWIFFWNLILNKNVQGILRYFQIVIRQGEILSYFDELQPE